MVEKKQYFNVVIINKKNDDLFLLVTSNSEGLSLPSGLLTQEEAPIDACVREVDQKTGILLEKKYAVELSKREDEKSVSYSSLFFFKENSVSLNSSKSNTNWISLKELNYLLFDHGAILCEALGKFWSFMPSYDPLLEIAKVPTTLDRPIIFFSGSFNPWHEGHKMCVKLCLNKVSDAQIVVVPDYSPWKERQSSEISSKCFYESYLNLCSSLQKLPVSIYPGFLGKAEVNPTVEWLPKVQLKKKMLLIGADSFLDILKWKESEKLLTNLDELFVVPRGYDDEKLQNKLKKVLSVNSELSVTILPHHNYEDISSTKMRAIDENKKT